MRLITVLMLLSAILLFGCNAVSDMKDMFTKQIIVQEAIKEQYGLETQVGWRMHNGVLTYVTIVFSAEEVRDMNVADLEVVAQESVFVAFESTPKVLNVQIACKPMTE